MAYKGILKEHSSFVNFVLRITDWAAISVCGITSFYISGVSEYFKSLGQPGIPASYYYVIGLAVLVSAVVFPLFSMYRVWRGAAIFEEIKLVTLSWVAVAFCLAALALMTKTGAHYSRMWGGVWFVTTAISFVAVRILLRLFLRWMRSNGFNQRQIVIVGTGSLAKEVAERISAASWTGLEIVGFFAEKDGPQERNANGLPVVGHLSDLAQFVRQNAVDQVWIAMPLNDEDAVRAVLHDLRHCTADVRFVPDIFGFQLLNHSITEIAGLPVLNLSVTPMEGLNLWLKALEDRVLAVIILALTSPLMLLIAIAVKLGSLGPVFYRQVRVSWNGEPFVMLKFRSMPVGAEQDTGPTWASAGEDRATWFGSFLRKTSLDELPQLINVLRGDMSIVGPRPERPVFVEKFKEEIPDYMKKHMVKAGITGWAQINGWRGNTDLRKRVEHDIYYIENWSLWFDLKIIFLTLFRGFVHKNAY